MRGGFALEPISWARRLVERLERKFPETKTAASNARGFLREALRTWQLDGFGEVTELLTSELVSNVVQHVGSPMTVRATLDGDRMRIEVDDLSTDMPVLKHPRPEEPGGLGILFVDTLADRWGTDVSQNGKTVWFEIDVRVMTRRCGSVEGSS
jgi:anti-sigma regulatory factor (Ser/Thr protein kinase)